MSVDFRGRIDDVDIYVERLTRVEQREGESMLVAFARTKAECAADCRAPEVVMTPRQFADLAAEILAAREVTA